MKQILSHIEWVLRVYIANKVGSNFQIELTIEGKFGETKLWAKIWWNQSYICKFISGLMIAHVRVCEAIDNEKMFYLFFILEKTAKLVKCKKLCFSQICANRWTDVLFRICADRSFERYISSICFFQFKSKNI